MPQFLFPVESFFTIFLENCTIENRQTFRCILVPYAHVLVHLITSSHGSGPVRKMRSFVAPSIDNFQFSG